MILYFANRLMRVIGLASTNLRGGISIVNDLKTEDVESGVATFSCNVLYDSSTRSQVETCASVGNYLFRNAGMGNELYTIVETENDTEAGSVYIYAEDAGLGLLNTVALAYSADSEKPISFYFEKWLDGTGFVIRWNDVPSEKKQLSWSSEATVTERLLDVAGQFDCEMSFGFDINGLSVAGKYVDIHRKRGKDIGVQLRLNSDVSKIVTKTTMGNLATGLLAVGGNQNGSDVSVTLEGYSYDDGDCYVSGRYLYSRTALNRWGERGPDGQLSHMVRLFSSDTVSQENLCNLAVAELKKSSEPEVNYEIELAKPPDGLCIGDRVNIVDDAGALYLSARVLKLETSIADDTRTATLGEFLLRNSGIAEKVEALARQFASADLHGRYTWIAYADDANGGGISKNPDGKAYMGTAANQTSASVDISDPSIFTWVRVRGDTGSQGSAGAQGDAGADATAYSIISSVTTMARNLSSTKLMPESVTFSAYSKTGSASQTPYSGYFVIECSYDGGATWPVSSDSEGEEVSYGPAASNGGSALTTVRASLYSGSDKSELLSTKSVSVVLDDSAVQVLLCEENNEVRVNGAMLAAGSVAARSIDVQDLFAQNIEASGTIKGATLEGAKLIGEEIDITASDERGTTSIKTSVNGDGNRTIEIYDSGGSSGLKSYINIANGTIRIAGQSLQIDTDEISTTASIIDSVNTYTTFDSDLISSGSVRVTRLLGKLCLLEGNLTLSGAASSTTVILDANKVPANAAGTKYINLSNSQNSSFTRPLALRTTASGGLAMHYGAAARYDFSWLYVTS